MSLRASLNLRVWSRMISSPCGSLAGEKNVTLTGWPEGFVDSEPPTPGAPQAANAPAEPARRSAVPIPRTCPLRVYRIAAIVLPPAWCADSVDRTYAVGATGD